MQHQNVKQSIYVLPNLFASMNLFCGYSAITAAVTVSLILFFSRMGMGPGPCEMALLALMSGLSFCMVSSFRYKRLKKVLVFKSMTVNKLVGLVLIIVALAAKPEKETQTP